MILEQSSRIRYQRLRRQRSLQIRRDGVCVLFVDAVYPSCTHFQFQMPQLSKVRKILSQQRYSLEICHQDGQVAVKVKPNELYLDGNYIGLSSGKRWRTILQEGQRYYLVKHNPTIHTHKEIYSYNNDCSEGKSDNFSQHLVQYIEGEILEIQTPQQELIIFQHQPDLNPSQNSAIQKAGINSLTFVKGPPGCGKTSTIARMCRLFLEKEMKVMVGAVSNTGIIAIARLLVEELSLYNNSQAIINAMALLASEALGIQDYMASMELQKYIRFNFIIFTPLQSKEEYFRLDPLLRFYSLNTSIIRNILRVSHEPITISTIFYWIEQMIQKQSVPNQFYAIYMKAISLTVSEAQIIISTTVTAASINDRLHPENHFQPSVAILDEASQASWADTYCYLKFNVRKLIQVGDQNQLDPTVISNDRILKESVFTKLSAKNPNYFVLLDLQYRMHPQIAELSNSIFYHGLIKNGVSTEERESNIPYFKSYPLSFISHNFEEVQSVDVGGQNKKNYYNIQQIFIIRSVLLQFKKEDLCSVGIITPYGAQLKYLCRVFQSEIINYGLTIKTCDGYQGGEKDYIFISCVRSNQEGRIGFCGERNRVNVSLTRARKGMLIVGNFQTLSAEQNVWQTVIQFFLNKNKLFCYSEPIWQEQIDQMFMNPIIFNDNEVKMNDVDPSIHQPYASDNQQRPSHEITEPNLRMPNIAKVVDFLKRIAQVTLDQDDDDEVNSFFKKNKIEVKAIRKLSIFSLEVKPHTFSAQDYIDKIKSIFPEKLTLEGLEQRLTTGVCKSYLEHLSVQNYTHPEDALRQVLQGLHPDHYSNNHILESRAIFAILKWLIMIKLLLL